MMTDDQYRDLQADVHDIKEAVIGNEEYKRPGLVQRVGNIELWQSEMNLRVAKVVGGWIVVSALIEIAFLYFQHAK